MNLTLELLAKQFEVSAGEQIVNKAKSPLLPQIGLDVTGLQINKERAGIAQPERSVTGTATVSQVIYVDDAWANYSVQKEFQKSREQEFEALRLDIAQEIATAVDAIFPEQLISVKVRDEKIGKILGLKLA